MFQPARRADLSARLLALAIYLSSVALPIRILDRTGLILCPFREITGLPCPACGMTHAFLCISHGNLAGAWHYNALALPLYIGGLVWLVREFSSGRYSAPPLLPRWLARWLPVVLIIAFLAFGLYRILAPSARPF